VISGRTAYALFAPLFALLATHHLFLTRGPRYLSLVEPGARRLAIASAVLAGAVGMAAAVRRRRIAPSLPPALLAIFGLFAGVAEGGTFLASSSATALPVALVVSALMLSFLGGAASILLVRTLRALALSPDEALSLLRVEAIAVALVGVVLVMAVADRAGPLRMGLALDLALVLLAAKGARELAPASRSARATARLSTAAAALLAAGIVLVEPMTPIWETTRLADPALSARNGLRGRAVVTSGRGAEQLYLDGTMRLSSLDAHRRREAVAGPALSLLSSPETALVIGGGDGSVARELLHEPSLRSVTLVEPEAALFELARTHPFLLRENAGALSSSRVRTVVADPLVYLRDTEDRFDLVVLDLPDPDRPSRSKLFTRYAFSLAGDRLTEAGIGVLVASSPLSTRRAFWCAVATLESAGLLALPYRIGLPSMGSLGLALFARRALSPPDAAGAGLSHLDRASMVEMFHIPADEARVEVEPSLLHHQTLLRYREEGFLTRGSRRRRKRTIARPTRPPAAPAPGDGGATLHPHPPSSLLAEGGCAAELPPLPARTAPPLPPCGAPPLPCPAAPAAALPPLPAVPDTPPLPGVPDVPPLPDVPLVPPAPPFPDAPLEPPV
jgi:spermidine synthase